MVSSITAFAMSSQSLRAKAQKLAVGESFTFIPRVVVDAECSVMEQDVVNKVTTPFVVARVALGKIPNEYGLLEEDLSLSAIALLISPEDAPAVSQLAILGEGTDF